MKNTIHNIKAVLILLFIINNIYAQESIENYPKAQKYSVSIDGFKLPTLVFQKYLRNEVGFRYNRTELLYYSAVIGAGSKNKDVYKYNYKSQAKGAYMQLGIGITPKLNQYTWFVVGYNLGLLTFNNRETLQTSSDFWGDTIKFVINEKGQKLYHELFMAFNYDLFILKDKSIFIEPAIRLRFGLTGVKESNNRTFYAGYGHYTSYEKSLLAISCQIGLKF